MSRRSHHQVSRIQSGACVLLRDNWMLVSRDYFQCCRQPYAHIRNRLESHQQLSRVNSSISILFKCFNECCRNTVVVIGAIRLRVRVIFIESEVACAAAQCFVVPL